MTTQFKDDEIVKGSQFIASIRDLNERMGLKVALALAGVSPALFTQLLTVVKSLETAPVSTLSQAEVPRLTAVGK